MALLLLFCSSLPGHAVTLTTQTLWGTPGSETVQAAAVDPDGNIYLTGNHRVGFDASKIFLVKFNSSHVLVWQLTWDGPDQFLSNEASDVAIAPDGSAVYVTGRSFFNGNGAVLLKFNPADGALVWSKSWGGNAFPSGVAVAHDGSVYVAGSVQVGQNQKIFVTKFDPAGAPANAVLWHKYWDTPASGGETQSDAVTVDGAGDVYIAGVTPRFDPNQPDAVLAFDIVVLKLDAAGNLLMQRTIGAGGGVDARGGIAVAPDGSIYVAGGRFDERTSDLNALVLKLEVDGDLAWIRHWGGRSGDAAGGVAVSAAGSVFVSGETNSYGAGIDDVFILQLAPDAREIDAATWGGPDIDHGDSIADLRDGTVVIGATATDPPYAFVKARRQTSRDRALIGNPSFPLVDFTTSGVTDVTGTVEPIAGTGNDELGYDAALLVFGP